MKIAVLSDIHSNHHALAASLKEAEARGCEVYLFLGDYISDCAYPEKTLALLYDWREKRTCHFLRGNREEYMLAHRAGGEQHWAPCSESGSLYYTYNNLTEKDLDWFATLPNCLRVELPGCPAILCCHGSPEDTRGNMRPNEPETWEVLKTVKEPIVLHGHLHHQWAFSAHGKRVINPGACGNTIDAAQRSCFAVLTIKNGQVELEHVQLPYNVQGAVDELYTSGLADIAPVWVAAVRELLLTGENYPMYIFRKAYELAGNEPTTEDHWLRAAEELNLSLERRT